MTDVNLEGQTKAADPELELVIAVIRRGLVEGDKIQNYEERLASMATALKEAKRRLIALARVGQEVCRNYEQSLDPNRKQAMTAAEAIEKMKWIQEKRSELKELLE